MSATTIRKVSLCMFACYTFLLKRALSKFNIVYELFVLFDLRFRCVDVTGLRNHRTVMSLYVLLDIGRSYQGMKWFSRAVI